MVMKLRRFSSGRCGGGEESGDEDTINAYNTFTCAVFTDQRFVMRMNGEYDMSFECFGPISEFVL